jgi:hypothetical protein
MGREMEDGDLREAAELGLLLLPEPDTGGVTLIGVVLRFDPNLAANDRALRVRALLEARERVE